MASRHLFSERFRTFSRHSKFVSAESRDGRVWERRCDEVGYRARRLGREMPEIRRSLLKYLFASVIPH